ncbi:hypothetical protein [Perlucidibaca aquatica]|jgi:hypothetical protein|uniref:hypothetical protein n=1 Tax=Perlucidibaca aquatica TaxID=1852776 RepID=UPI00083B5F3B|nr:hypothetical protein [Perlucidibaca aquatica]
MSWMIYLICWLLYLAAATVLYRVFITPHLAVWFPNSERLARLFFLVVLFSPALLAEQGNLSLAPALMLVLLQLLMKSPLGVFKAILPWFLFGGLALVLDAARRRRESI